MRSYYVIVYGEYASPPVLHLITAIDDVAAVVFADMVLGQSPHGIGVIVSDSEGGRLYAQGKVPVPSAGRTLGGRQSVRGAGRERRRIRTGRAFWRFVFSQWPSRA